MSTSLTVCFDASPIGAPIERWSGVARVVSQFLQEFERSGLRYGLSASGSLRGHYFVESHLKDWGWSDRFMGRQLSPLGACLIQASSRKDYAGFISSQILRAWNITRRPIRRESLGACDFYFSFFPSIPRQVRRAGVPAGLFVHDMIPLRFPEFCAPKQIPIFKRMIGSLQEGDLVVTNSECTKRDFCSWSGWSPDRVDVVPLAADPSIFYPESAPERREAVRSKYAVHAPEGYFLSLNAGAPHKNLSMLVRAYALYRSDVGSCALPLVLAGGKDMAKNDLAYSLGLPTEALDGVQFIGFVDDIDLAALYSGAKAFFFPSLYEGFGLPVVEAMMCGTPVYVADRASLPEIVTEEGRLLDPQEPSVWSAAFCSAEQDEALTSDEIDIISKRFNWAGSTAKLVESIDNHLSKLNLS